MDSRHEQKQRTALVTGASSGIGLEVARILAEEGYDLVLVSRQEDRLAMAASELLEFEHRSVYTIAVDLSDPEGPYLLRDATEELGLEITALINNAGFGWVGRYDEQDLESEERMLQLNVRSLVCLTKLYLDQLRASGCGELMNVASAAAFQPGPRMALYYATKAFVLSYTEAVAEELGPLGVRVTCLCPGPTASGFGERAGARSSWILRVSKRSAVDVARYGVRAMHAGRVVAIPGLMNRAATILVRALPRILVRKITKHLNR